MSSTRIKLLNITYGYSAPVWDFFEGGLGAALARATNCKAVQLELQGLNYGRSRITSIWGWGGVGGGGGE